MTGHVDRSVISPGPSGVVIDATETVRVGVGVGVGVGAGAGRDRGWRRFGRDVGDEANTMADRDDLIVAFPDGIPGRHPAMFVAGHAAISVDRAHFPGIDPATALPDRDSDRARYPVGWGLLVHECAHAHHSIWTEPPDADPAVLDAALLLEESRIEARHLRRRPQDRPWLRAAAQHLILAEAALPPPPGTTPAALATAPIPPARPEPPREQAVEPLRGPDGAARLAALILARVSAGVLAEHETRGVRANIVRVLGQDVLDTLTGIWRDAHTVADDDATGMLAVGRRWCDAIGTTTTAEADAIAGNSAAAATVPPASGGPGDSSPIPDPGSPVPDRRAADGSTPPGSDPTGPGPAGAEPGVAEVGASSTACDERLLEAVVVDLARLADGVAGEVAAVAAADPVARAAAAAADTARAHQRKTAEARSVFSTPRSAGSPIIGTRPPTAVERQAARRLGRALDTAGTPERVATRTSSALPPGRLRMRGALAADAQRAAGQVPTAEPFSRTHRRIADPPALRLGVACDVSGSMTQVADPVASAAWILAAAARYTRVDTTTASVVFGTSVHPVVTPGEHPARVTRFAARGAWEAADQAIDALDGALGLSVPGAARLLVIVSDGRFKHGPDVRAQVRVDALIRSGCGVLWLAPTPAVTGNTPTPLHGPVVIALHRPATTADTIATAATAALRAATRTRH